MSDPGPALAAYLDELRVTSRPHRAALGLLHRPCTLAELVDATALSRRAVERLVRALEQDGALDQDGGAGPRRESRYALRDPSLAERCAPPADEGLDVPALAARLAPLVAAAPRADRHLDHVAATPASVARRARWMADELYLPGATVAFVGDHDLTSVALAMLAPDVRIVVVDLDERLLAYLDEVLGRLGVRYDLRRADLRERLPAELTDFADVFVTDPPYTPEGVALFVARGLAMLRPGLHTRGLLAYGYGEQLPTLGLKVQKALLGLDVALVEMVRDFGRYTGAHAVGAASDWYVLAPTPRTARRVQALAGPAADRRIYTHGRESQEAARPDEAAPPDGRGPPETTPATEPPVDARRADDVLRELLSRRPSASVRTAAVDALFKAGRARGSRRSRGEVREALDAVDPWRTVRPEARLDTLSSQERSVLLEALNALVPG